MRDLLSSTPLADEQHFDWELFGQHLEGQYPVSLPASMPISGRRFSHVSMQIAPAGVEGCDYNVYCRAVWHYYAATRRETILHITEDEVLFLATVHLHPYGLEAAVEAERISLEHLLLELGRALGDTYLAHPNIGRISAIWAGGGKHPADQATHPLTLPFQSTLS